MYTCNLRLEIAHRNTFNDKVKDKKRKPWFDSSVPIMTEKFNLCSSGIEDTAKVQGWAWQ